VRVPLGAVDRLPADALAGKVVIDTSKYYPERDGHVAELDDGTETTSQRVQRLLPGAHVVKAFNDVDFARLPALARDGRPGRRAALPVSGGDETALVVVEESRPHGPVGRLRGRRSGRARRRARARGPDARGGDDGRRVGSGHRPRSWLRSARLRRTPRP